MAKLGTQTFAATYPLTPSWNPEEDLGVLAREAEHRCCIARQLRVVSRCLGLSPRSPRAATRLSLCYK